MWLACILVPLSMRWYLVLTKRVNSSAGSYPTGLPMKYGQAETLTHDYKRNGTTTLFAALNTLDGKVIGQCLPRHRHQEFLKFLRILDRHTTKQIDLHLILDNYSTHIIRL